MKLKKWFGAVLSLLLVVAMAIGMVACAPEAKEPCESHPTDKLVAKEIEGDDNSHQVFCTECNNNVKKAFHNYKAEGNDMVCSDCGHKCSHASTTYSVSDDFLHHYQACTACYKKLTEDEGHTMVNGTCSKCGTTQETLDQHDVNNTTWELLGNGAGMMGSNNWTSGNGKRLKKVEGDADKAFITGNMYAGDLFKVHDSDSDAWIGFDNVTTESQTLVVKDNDNFGGWNIKVLQDGNYTINFTLSSKSIEIVRNGDPDGEKDYYLVGCVDGDTMFGKDTRKYQLTESTTTPGIWTVDYTVTAKDCPTNWPDGVDGCAKFALWETNETKNIVDGSQMWVAPGEYTFAFNGSVLQAFPKGTPESEFTFNEWFLVGKLNIDRWEGMSADLAFTKSAEGVYTFTYDFQSNYEFKIRNGKTYLGFDSISPAPTGFSAKSDSDTNIVCNTAGKYTITVTTTGSAPSLKIEAAAN